MPKTPILQVKNLSLGFYQDKKLVPVLQNITYNLYTNEILGIVGESGSGKSVTNLAVMGLLPKKITRITSGTARFYDTQLLDLSEKEFRKIRGNKISMIFQEPMSSLNPSMRCGTQVAEILKLHTPLSRNAIKKRVLELFAQVKLPHPEKIYSSYPHQISGGQMQRVMIAMAIACEPEILIADEPTTALDVTVQREIINLLKELQQKTHMSIVFISHDLALVSEFADRVLVMYQGKVIEKGSAKDIFKNPEKKYTKALIYARPVASKRPKRLPTVSDFLTGQSSSQEITPTNRKHKHELLYSQKPLIEVNNASKHYLTKINLFKKEVVKAVDDISFKIYAGETLGLVGESGCGKSTLGAILLGLIPASSGHIFYKGKDLVALNAKELRELRKEIQIIFQDPYSSLNPRLTVGQSITEVMRVHNLYPTKNERKKQAEILLEKVGLLPEHYNRYPHQFSGGQRQRIGIARTIAVQPKFIVCDESVSALDISVQAQVLNLLNTLKEDFNFTYLFISHDLAVVKYMADRLLVMQAGIIKEQGEADEVYTNPQSAYTKTLIEAIPKGI